jgi:hypothetical protein
MHRGGGAGEVIDLIDFEQDRFDDVVADDFEVLIVAQMENVRTLAAEVIVEADDLVPFFEQALAEMGTEKAGAAGNK